MQLNEPVEVRNVARWCLSRLSLETPLTKAILYIVKIVGKGRRFERTLKILRRMKADRDPRTACVCQDDSMREKLLAHGIRCLSFYEQLDRETELEAWTQAVRVKEEMFSCLSEAAFAVKDYQCPECFVGVDADRFASLAMIVSLKNKLIRNGFETIIVLLAEEHLHEVPDASHGPWRVVASRDPRETLRVFGMRLYSYIMPFVAIFSPRLLFQEYAVYHKLKRPQLGTESRHDHPRVLVVATDNEQFPSYYSRPAAAIAGGCAEHGHEVLIVTNSAASSAEFMRRGFERFPYKKGILAQLWTTWSNILRTRTRASKCARGVPENVSPDLWSLSWALVKQSASTAALATTAGIMLCDELFAQFRPDVLVVIPDSWYLGISAVAVARKKGIPSLTTLAGQVFDHPQYGFLNADVIAVNGNLARDVFLKHGISPERAVVTGMAQYDETFRLSKSIGMLRKPTKSRLVVFATENLPLAETFRMITPVAEAVLARPSLKMTIRPHPRENPDNYKEFVRRSGSDRIALDLDTPIQELLTTAAVCVTGFSNVAVEAMIFDRPVICMNLTGQPDKLEYVREGAALGVYRPEETASALYKALFDETANAALANGRKAFLEKHFYRADGNATARIIKVIEELAENRPNRPRYQWEKKA